MKNLVIYPPNTYGKTEIILTTTYPNKTQLCKIDRIYLDSDEAQKVMEALSKGSKIEIIQRQ